MSPITVEEGIERCLVALRGRECVTTTTNVTCPIPSGRSVEVPPPLGTDVVGVGTLEPRSVPLAKVTKLWVHLFVVEEPTRSLGVVGSLGTEEGCVERVVL